MGNASRDYFHLTELISFSVSIAYLTLLFPNKYA